MSNKKPYIVKFSGGRSSAMMLMKLLKNNQLNPKRGDIIIFNNTSAEHPATYEFTRKIKKIAEEEYKKALVTKIFIDKVHTLETILGKNPLREIISSNTSPL
jgi:3'-phosphoadenosine 5'-phosphosulfate sulfotransferase (PAPS reductase)/FAD synthetase